jgi:hypothetical protein
MTNEQAVPTAVAQCIIVKYITYRNVKHAKILISLRAQFGDETFSRSHTYDWSKLFKEG